MKASSSAVSECFMFIYFFCPTACPPHGEAKRRPASEQSCRQGMSPPRGFCGGSHGSAARSHCWCGCASNAHWENRSRSASPQLGSLLQLHGAQFGNDFFSLLAGCLFALPGVDRLEHFCHNFDLGFRQNRENIAIEMHCAALVFGVREHLAHGLQHPPCTCRRR